MYPMGYRSIVNHLRALIFLAIAVFVGGVYFAIEVRSEIVEVSDTVLETAKAVNQTNKTVRTSHELITAFLEAARDPLIRGAENSDAIKANSAELTQAMRDALEKMEALEERGDRLERSVATSQEQLAELLNTIHNPFQGVIERFRGKE